MFFDRGPVLIIELLKVFISFFLEFDLLADLLDCSFHFDNLLDFGLELFFEELDFVFLEFYLMVELKVFGF